MNILFKKILITLGFLLFLLGCATSPKEENEMKKAEILYNIGTTKLQNGEYTQGLSSLMKAYELSPDSSKINNNLGMAYYLKDSLPNAGKHFKKAVDIDPKNIDALNNLASYYFRVNNITKAKDIYLKISKFIIVLAKQLQNLKILYNRYDFIKRKY